MENRYLQSVQQNFQISKILFFALLAGMVLFFAIIYFLLPEYDQKDDEVFNILLILTAVISASMVFIPRKIYESAIKRFDKSKDLNSKIIHHRTQNIVRWALIESSVLLALVSAFITGEQIFFIFTAVMITFFFINKPTIEKFADEYRLNSEEKSKLYRS